MRASKPGCMGGHRKEKRSQVDEKGRILSLLLLYICIGCQALHAQRSQLASSIIRSCYSVILFHDSIVFHRECLLAGWLLLYIVCRVSQLVHLYFTTAHVARAYVCKLGSLTVRTILYGPVLFGMNEAAAPFTAHNSKTLSAIVASV